jgi:hypothetical protein
MRRFILAAAIGWACVVGASEANAQISFGNGDFGVTIGGPAWQSNGYYGYQRGVGYGPYGPGHRGGYGYNGYAPTFGPVWGTEAFYPQPNVPPRYTRSYSAASAATTTSIERPGAGRPIKIVSPESAGVPIRYSLNQYDYTIQPGESQTITNDREWVITFDKGGDFGTAKYTLAPGLYKFALTETGWQVYHTADVDTISSKPTVDKPVAKNELPIK